MTWAPWPFMASVPQTRKLMPSDVHGLVSFMESVVYVTGIHRCAAAWRWADPSISSSSHPGKHTVSVSISVMKLLTGKRLFYSFTEIKASFMLLSAPLLLSWSKMLQPSFCATVPMDWDDSFRTTQDVLASAISRAQTPFLPLPLLSSVVLVVSLHWCDVGLCFGVPRTDKPREVVSGDCNAAGGTLGFAGCFACTSI